MLFITYSTVLMECACFLIKGLDSREITSLPSCLSQDSFAYNKCFKHPITSPPHRNFSPKDFSATEIFSCSKVINAFNSWTDTFMKSSTSFALMHTALENFCTRFSIKVAPWSCPQVDYVSAEGARDACEASDECSVCRRLNKICIMLARNNGS